MLSGANGGYRAVGKHRFAAGVIGLALMLTLVGVVLSQWVGDARSTAIVRLLTALLWMVASSRSLLMSDMRLVDTDPNSDATPSKIRGWSIFALIVATAAAVLDARSLVVLE